MANLSVKDASNTTVELAASGAGSSGDPYIQKTQPNYIEYSAESITAPGNSASRSFAGFKELVCAVTVATINTSLIIRLEGQIVSSGAWVNLAANDEDSTISANGTYGFQWYGTALNVRLVFVSESGGTDATLSVAWRFQA